MYSLSLRPRHMAWVCSLAAALICGSISESHAQPGAELVTDITVTGSTTDGNTSAQGSFSGQLTLTEIHFDASTTDTLILVGNLTGTAVQGAETTDVVEQLFTTTGTLTAIGGTKNKCGLLTLDISNIELAMLNMDVDVDDITIDVAAARGKARNLGNQLCKLSRFIAKADINQVNKIINKIITIIKPPLTNVAVTGVANNTGTFTGFMSLDRLDVDPNGNIMATGIISGVAVVNAQSNVIAGEPFVATARFYGTSFGGSSSCDTLFVDLGTVVLANEGVSLELDDVVVHTGATQGNTKKAAKALCGIVKTLAKQEVKPVDTLKLVKKLTKQVVKINTTLLP